MSRVLAPRLVALSLLIAAPAASLLVEPTTAHADDKSKSPASREISDAEYVLKELDRLTGLSGWESEKFKIEMVEGQAKDCADAVAKVKKADPKWNVAPWEKKVTDAQARAKKAKEALGSAPAKPAGPDASKSAASDDIALTGGSVLGLEKKMKDTTDWSTDPSKLDGAKTAIEGVESGLKRIKSKDPKWDTAAWDKLVKDARARLKKAQDIVDTKAAADKANEDAYREYVWKLSPLREGFDLLVKLDKKPGDVEIYSKNQVVGNFAKSIAGVEALDKACKEKHYEKLTIPGFYKNEPPATEACKVAAKWKDLGKKYIELQVKGGVPKHVKYLEGQIAAMKKGDNISAADHKGLLDPAKHIDFYRKEYDDAAKTLGTTTDTAWYEPIKTIAATYPAALQEAEKTSRFDTKAKIPDQAAASYVAKQHAKGGSMDEGQVIKVNAAFDWDVKRDVFKTPISRSRDVHVMVKIKGETYCRVYFRGEFSPFQSGAFAAPNVSGGESQFRISACK